MNPPDESMTETVTTVLQKRLVQGRIKGQTDAPLPARLAALSERLREAYDTRPVSQAVSD
jgi:hypothetical protein